MFNYIKKSKLIIWGLVFSISLFVIYTVIDAYSVNDETPFNVCGHIQPYYQSKFEPPRNIVYRFLWKTQLFSPLCNWWRKEFGLRYNRDLDLRNISPAYVANFADEKILMGASHNVFVGKVTKQIGTSITGIPETQFEVDPLYSFKGKLDGPIIVNQHGGYRERVLYIVMGGDLLLPNEEQNYLLQLGKTYLFATRYNYVKNWYTLNPHPNARKTISGDPNLTKEQLVEIAKNDPRVQVLEEAYKYEILLDADIYHNNTLNSYKSLHPEEKN